MTGIDQNTNLSLRSVTTNAGRRPFVRRRPCDIPADPHRRPAGAARRGLSEALRTTGAEPRVASGGSERKIAGGVNTPFRRNTSDRHRAVQSLTFSADHRCDGPPTIVSRDDVAVTSTGASFSAFDLAAPGIHAIASGTPSGRQRLCRCSNNRRPASAQSMIHPAPASRIAIGGVRQTSARGGHSGGGGRTRLPLVNARNSPPRGLREDGDAVSRTRCRH
jgi:hypothetical protein